MSDIQTPFSLSQLLVILVLGFLVIRWIFFSSTPSSQSSHGHASGTSRVNPAQVEQVSQMFPQLDRRDIMWDLQRNGGNVQATTERILNGRTLEVVRLRTGNFMMKLG
jgi:coupling of ubiquitin conjugation to ER degradation protein 1